MKIWPAVPKVTVSKHGVTCEDCQRTFQQAGSHFRTIHQVPKTRNITERLLLYGLKFGDRLASAADQLARSEANLFNGNKPPGSKHSRREIRRAGVLRSAAQRRVFDRARSIRSRNLAAKKEAAP
jgi:hypothetical protein